MSDVPLSIHLSSPFLLIIANHLPSVFATPALSKAYLESLMLHEVCPNDTSRLLAQNIIFSLAGQPPTYPSTSFLIASTRWLNGDILCDALHLPPSTLKSKILVMGQCLFYCYFGYASRLSPWFDKRKIATMRKAIYKVIVEGKMGLGGETGFEFHYVPQLDTITEGGKIDLKVDWGERTAERRNMKFFLMGVGLVGILGGVGVWILWSVIRFLWGSCGLVEMGEINLGY